MAPLDAVRVFAARMRGHAVMSENEQRETAAAAASDPEVDLALRRFLDTHPEYPRKDSGVRELSDQ